MIQISENPTGRELYDALCAAAALEGLKPATFCRTLSSAASRWLQNVRETQNPHHLTIARVKAVLAGEPVPPPNPKKGHMRGRKHTPEMLARRYQVEAPMPVPEQAPVYRDPCWHCGVRGDIGCHHTPAGGW